MMRQTTLAKKNFSKSFDTWNRIRIRAKESVRASFGLSNSKTPTAIRVGKSS